MEVYFENLFGVLTSSAGDNVVSKRAEKGRKSVLAYQM
jgi:hypothetical protein